jgi:hypothetical protein
VKSATTWGGRSRDGAAAGAGGAVAGGGAGRISLAVAALGVGATPPEAADEAVAAAVGVGESTASGEPAGADAIANSHRPCSVAHGVGRTNCGRGYSGSGGEVAFISADQRVVKL